MSVNRDGRINSSPRRRATRTAFFIAGFAMGVWAPLVPYAQHRLNIGSGELGSLLLCLGLGSMITMFFTGRLTSRFGSRPMIILGVLIVCITLPLLATVNTTLDMIGSLLLFGAGLGLTEVTVNIQGALVERYSSRPLMSGFHAFYSIGGIGGAALGSVLLSLGLSPLQMVLGSIILMLGLLAYCRPHLLPFAKGKDDEHVGKFRINARLLLMALVCLCSFLAEGAILDWSGIWLNQERGLAIQYAGVGYVCFGGAMALMRLIGDRFIYHVGRFNSLIISGSLAAAGYILAVITPEWQLSLAGFVLVGIGASNVVPIITTLASQEPLMPTNKSVAFVSTLGYVGILMGPAALGGVAHLASLATAFISVAVLMVVVLISGLYLRNTA